MNRTTLRQQLTSWPGVAALCLLIVAGTLSVKLWPRTVPYEQCSDIYKKYAGTDGIEAAFVKDYRINDTLTLPVTLLETKDTNIWENLCKDFGITPLSIVPKEIKSTMTPENTFFQHIINDTLVSGHGSTYIKHLIIFSHLEQSMCIFTHIDELQHDAILDKEFEEITQ